MDRTDPDVGNTYSTILLDSEGNYGKNADSSHNCQCWMRRVLKNTNTIGEIMEVECNEQLVKAAFFDSDDIRVNNVCPNGWRIPSDFDWLELESRLGYGI